MDLVGWRTLENVGDCGSIRVTLLALACVAKSKSVLITEFYFLLFK